MQIGELSEAVGLSLRTIRHYDDVGLLPASRTEGGYRVYSENDLKRMLAIRTLKPLGFSLETMRGILDVIDAVRADAADIDARDRLRAYTAQIEEKREQMALNLERATRLVADLDELE
ncbi:MerR family transcriptional regulator [Zhihengliuella halotolerans]|uniref:MerR family transcriptional regulator n=1 Tax=Zhihengliuella halotolerans TaxID=370736 RepID=UPI000C80ACA1|nr:MerR family transcriptional regulator [Zhihengliuella halotolerans]